MNEIERAKRLSQTFVHFVTARASLFTDHEISGLPIRAKYRHFRTICVETVDNSTKDWLSSLKWWSSKHGVATLYNSSVFLFASSQYLSTHFFAWPSMSQDHEEVVFVSDFRSFSFRWLFHCTSRNSGFKHTFMNYPQYPCLYDLLFECIPTTHGLGRMLVLPNKRLSFVFSTLDSFSASFQPVLYRPHTLIRTVLSLG